MSLDMHGPPEHLTAGISAIDLFRHARDGATPADKVGGDPIDPRIHLLSK
jgi:hypothetical protein